MVAGQVSCCELGHGGKLVGSLLQLRTGPGTAKGLCCFSEVQAGLWDLWWYPLKANLRSGVGIKIYMDFPPRLCLLTVSSSPSFSGTWRFMRRIRTAQRAPLPPHRWNAGDCLRNGSSVTMLSWTERRGHLQKRFFTGHEAKDVPGYLLNCQLLGLCSQHRLVTALCVWVVPCLSCVASMVVWEWK